MVHIDQTDTIDLLTRMEGAQWRATQETHPEDPAGYRFWQRAWGAKVAAGMGDMPVPLAWFAERATRAPEILGGEIYRRYRVNGDGEVVMLKDGVMPDTLARAESLGFRMA
jgi:hypothetical protein